MAIEVTRTYVGSIQNQRQVCDGLDSLGDSASKLWNVARWTADRIWDETGEIPDEGTLKAYMKNQACWKDLNAQSSQKVIEELSDAFQSWFDLRQTDDEANPPGYRKHGDTRPKSTVTFKADGFKHDPENNRVRLSKARISKRVGRTSSSASTRPARMLTFQRSRGCRTMRAVWNGDEWKLHFVCKVELETTGVGWRRNGWYRPWDHEHRYDRFPQRGTSCIPVTHSNGTSTTSREAEYDTEGENGPSEKSMWARRKLTERETHFYHVLTDTIITECVERECWHRSR